VTWRGRFWAAIEPVLDAKPVPEPHKHDVFAWPLRTPGLRAVLRHMRAGRGVGHRRMVSGGWTNFWGMKADTLAKTLLFCTVRVNNNHLDGRESVGTAFFFNASQDSGSHVLMLVSNKHVLENAAQLTLEILVANSDYSGPKLGELRRIPLGRGDGEPVPIIGHPDPAIDVAVLPVGDIVDVLHRATGETPFLKALGWDNLPTTNAMAQFDSIEQLTFVGYPGGLSDPVNHIPIVRQGITATPIGVPFNGLPTFLLDGAVFGGSSGSPVFVFSQTSWADSEGNINLGSRLFLVGIVSQAYNNSERLQVMGLRPAIAQPFVDVSQSLHLGVAVSTMAIVETINHALAAAGLPTGSGLQPYI